MPQAQRVSLASLASIIHRYAVLPTAGLCGHQQTLRTLGLVRFGALAVMMRPQQWLPSPLSQTLRNNSPGVGQNPGSTGDKADAAKYTDAE